jgi:N-acetylmuramoyl-L-alanine amidase
VTLAEVSGSLKVSIEFDEARALDLTSLADHAILADLRVAGAAADPSLPQAEMLASWVAGVSLQRRSQGTVRPRRLVVVDPGHGGRDSGAIGVTGTHESDIALALARRVARQLERTANAEVVLTRTEDVFIPLHERAAIANALDADLFLSIHANAAPAPTVWGIETYYLDTASDAGAARVAARENAIGNTQGPVESIVSDLLVTGTNRLSRELAQSVQADVILGLREVYGEEQIRDLGHKAALFAVLVWTRMPSVLFEAAFLTHPDDEMRLRNPLYQQTVAESIAVSVEAWFEAQGR